MSATSPSCATAGTAPGGISRSGSTARIDETTADYRTHALLAALRFEFQLPGGSETVLQRHAPPARATVLKICASDLMTRSAFIARPPADGSDPQFVERGEGSGYPSGCCDLPWHPGRQFLRLWGRDTW